MARSSSTTARHKPEPRRSRCARTVSGTVLRRARAAVISTSVAPSSRHFDSRAHTGAAVRLGAFRASSASASAGRGVGIGVLQQQRPDLDQARPPQILGGVARRGALSFVADARSWTISAFKASTVASDSHARASAARSARSAWSSCPSSFSRVSVEDEDDASPHACASRSRSRSILRVSTRAFALGERALRVERPLAFLFRRVEAVLGRQCGGI